MIRGRRLHSPLSLTTAQLRTLFQKTLINWGEDKVPRLAAAFSFYAMLSLAPLLVIAVVAGSIIMGKTRAETHLMKAAEDYLGEQAQPLMKALLSQVANTGVTTVAGILALLVTVYGASNLFLQLEESVNSIWGVKAKGPVFRNMVVQRLASFLMVLIFGLVAIAWLILDSWLGWLSRFAHGWGGWKYVSLGISAVFLAGVFACAYKWLPKKMVAWSDVWIAAAVAGFGTAVSKLLLAYYFEVATVSAAYGSAGALVVILLWIYYTSMIFFFGFEVTNTYAYEFGSHAGENLETKQYS
ncbi:MAG TPA: YihY/virulence factor BrkB family protein [Fimbriimonas sp.]